MLSKSLAKARDSDNRPASEIPYGLRKLNTFSKLEGMQGFDSARAPGPGEVSKCMAFIVHSSSELSDAVVIVPMYDATPYFMGPLKDPAAFELGRLEELKAWPMTEIPSGSFCAVIHSITQYRKNDSMWAISWNYYAFVVLGNMEVDS